MRSRIAAILVLLAALAGALAAPVPTHLMKPQPPLYFPTSVGAKWVYQCGEEEGTHVVTKVEEKRGVFTVSYGEADAHGKVTDVRKAEVSERGIFSLPAKDGEEPFQILKLPFKKGESWPGRSDSELVCEYLGEERIKVRGGEFDTVKVRWVYGRSQTLFEYCWYAPGIGLVKREIPKRLLIELVSFTPGKV